jgi:hypothetical protein
MNKALRPSLTRTSKIDAVVVFFLLSFLVSCERKEFMDIDGKNPPTFELSFRGKLQSFEVYEIIPTDPDGTSNGRLRFPLSAKYVAAWKIEVDPKAGATNDVRQISYGKVPAGFIQTYPPQDSAAALVEGKFYGATAIPDKPSDLTLAFSVVGGKSVLQ